MKKKLCWAAVILGVVSMLAFAVHMTVYRFQNDTLTETQITIWGLQRWWAWIPGMVAAFIGLWILRVR